MKRVSAFLYDIFHNEPLLNFFGFVFLGLGIGFGIYFGASRHGNKVENGLKSFGSETIDKLKDPVRKGFRFYAMKTLHDIFSRK